MNKMISIFKALSDQNRLKVLAALARYPELCACQLIELLQVTGATTSRHLDILINANLVDRRKEGRWVYYRLKSNNKDFGTVMDWVKKELLNSEDIQSCLRNLKDIAACNPKEFCVKNNGAKK